SMPSSTAAPPSRRPGNSRRTPGGVRSGGLRLLPLRRDLRAVDLERADIRPEMRREQRLAKGLEPADVGRAPRIVAGTVGVAVEIRVSARVQRIVRREAGLGPRGEDA